MKKCSTCKYKLHFGCTHPANHVPLPNNIDEGANSNQSCKDYSLHEYNKVRLLVLPVVAVELILTIVDVSLKLNVISTAILLLNFIVVSVMLLRFFKFMRREDRAVKIRNIQTQVEEISRNGAWR